MQDMENPVAPAIDISRLTFPQLSGLRQGIDERMREMRDTEGPLLRERMIEQAAAIGMTIEELVQLGAKRRGRPPKDREED